MTSSWRIGDIRVDRIDEDQGAFNDVGYSLPGLSVDRLEQEQGWFAGTGFDEPSRRLVLSFHSYIVRLGDCCVVIDTCIGNDKALAFRPAWNRKADGRWFTGLERIGVEAPDVDLVFNTHLHLDHVGWNTTWTGTEWVPTFPNARYVVAESEYVDARERAEGQSTLAQLHHSSLAESIEPLRHFDVLDLVPMNHQVDQDFRLIPTPGHTAGHVAVAVGEDDAVFVGDLLHSPIQALYPELHWAGDEDPLAAARSRRSLLDRYAETSTLVFTMHFPEPSGGLLRRCRDGYRLEPVQGSGPQPVAAPEED
jgi:glyoxylase-like metal-dependent hydrolase (beta-lactamase superfamily II)